MKLLGVFSWGLPKAYKELFENKGIKFSEKAVENTFVSIGWKRHPTKYQVFISDEDYDKAVNAIKDYEKQMEQKVAVDGKEADRTMLKFVIGIIVVFALIIYIGYKIRQ